jgi:two-component system sensor histidine kinase UhpB
LPAQGRDPYLARLVASFDGNRHIKVSLLEDGRVLAVSQLAPPEPAPAWFQALLAIPGETRRDAPPVLGPRAILVQSDPHNEISEAWSQLSDSALILALFSLLLLGLLHLVMRRMATLLARLGVGFAAVGGGDYGARADVTGPREIAFLARAFNHMAERLSALSAANGRMARQMTAIQEEERADLARDLHDEMGPFLFAVRVDAEAITKAAQQPVIQGHARAIGEAVTHMQAHLRLILKQLRPEGTAAIGLAQAIGNLAAFWQRHHPGIAIVLELAAEEGFGPDIDAALFRFVQEGLTNAARHSGARNVWVKLTADSRHIHAVLEDDGVGFGQSDTGFGLRGMQERFVALGGRMTREARPDGGARLSVTMPRISAPRSLVPA